MFAHPAECHTRTNAHETKWENKNVYTSVFVIFLIVCFFKHFTKSNIKTDSLLSKDIKMIMHQFMHLQVVVHGSYHSYKFFIFYFIFKMNLHWHLCLAQTGPHLVLPFPALPLKLYCCAQLQDCLQRNPFISTTRLQFWSAGNLSCAHNSQTPLKAHSRDRTFLYFYSLPNIESLCRQQPIFARTGPNWEGEKGSGHM